MLIHHLPLTASGDVQMAPIPFYERDGFERTAETHDEEVILRLDLRKHEALGGR